ncbi:phytoene desaturase family protein [Actinomadura montaniterrae]|uniref:Pyridine nucleotide-disulfide oxidoreductase domain-containing protein 2 n=1 Tax=Actinomadura montaniterrae TaxID=1803903 RepID=A0A6L3W0S3_9ACTN|nr:NAD(P)/FAD-dependent oxidoreductase [Actinomadura montaniterrae]KAB2384835.1 NAD(P)/FAD-dependent oxidoreductase [Actinomadura montaniterrae]
MTSAAAGEYDAIVVGGGHNGLTAAAYLQRAGLSTLVLEAGAETGGLATTVEPGPSGYLHNPHANYLMYHDIMPAVRDLRLRAHGLEVAWPKAQHGIAFADGRPPIVVHRADALDLTRASVARYSAADATRLTGLLRRADRVRRAMKHQVYNPPDHAGFERFTAAVETAYRGSVPRRAAEMPAWELIGSLFHTPELRTLLLRAAHELGADLTAEGSGMSFLGAVLPTLGRMRLPLGGMRTLARAMTDACAGLGVTVRTRARVKEIVTDGSAATGVRIEGGEILAARRAVVSSAGLAATLLDMVDADVLPPTARREVEEFAARPSTALASSMFCLRRRPEYSSGRWDPDIDQCFQVMVGLDDPGAVLQQTREVDQGALPLPATAVRVNSMWDPAQAPAGKHVAGADTVFPGFLHDSGGWADVAGSYNEALLDVLQRYAPNLNGGNVIWSTFVVPERHDRKIFLRSGTDQYRAPVRRLYLCGASTHPGGGVHGGPGYNALAAIAEDAGLPAAAYRHR